MEYIKDRQEIAKAINFGRYPVVYVEDITACRTDYGWRLGKVKIASWKGWYYHADIYIYSDEQKIVTTSYGACLSSRFGWCDVAEMAKNAAAPELKPNSEFVLVIGKKKEGERVSHKGAVVLVKTGAAQLGTDYPLVIDEDASGLLRALGEI